MEMLLLGTVFFESGHVAGAASCASTEEKVRMLEGGSSSVPNVVVVARSVHVI